MQVIIIDRRLQGVDLFIYKDVVELLLDHSGIDFNTTDDDGKTAFMLACQRGHQDVVQLLESKINL